MLDSRGTADGREMIGFCCSGLVKGILLHDASLPWKRESLGCIGFVLPQRSKTQCGGAGARMDGEQLVVRHGSRIQHALPCSGKHAFQGVIEAQTSVHLPLPLLWVLGPLIRISRWVLTVCLTSARC